MRIAWGITGSGHMLRETIDAMNQVVNKTDAQVDVFVSKAGKQVLHWYKMWDDLNKAFSKVKVEIDANTPFISGPLQVGAYDLLLVAPLTANSTAKIAHGIEDTLLTNAVAQTLKGQTQVMLLPVDQFPGETTTIAPDGRSVTICARKIDLDNAERLRHMPGVIVLSSADEIVERFLVLCDVA